MGAQQMKPMLAAQAELNKLAFPLLASAKLDGVRALTTERGLLSRSLKSIPNLHIQHVMRNFPQFFDGELIVGPPTSKTCYRDTVSAVMRIEGEPNFTFYVFDSFADGLRPYSERMKDMEFDKRLPGVVLQQHVVTDLDGLTRLESRMLDEGYEGLILRGYDAPYKYGRSTVKEGYLLKLKQFTDAEATVVGFEELMHNANEAKTNELGRTARSSHKENKRGLDTLGALICEWNGMTFNIGTGFDNAQRAEIWANRDKYKGQLAKFKYFPVGMKDLPRHPVWLGWRDERDT